MTFKRIFIMTLIYISSFIPLPSAQAQEDRILNVSYDIARELFDVLNPAFQKYWKKKTGRHVTIDMSHAGSSRQARSIIEGLNADVVTFNQETDVDFLAKYGFVKKDWRKDFPNQASPYYSLPTFLVRKGNPKNIQHWHDLARPGVQPIFPNPKTSGNARYTYLSAYEYGQFKWNNNPEKTQELVRKIFSNVPVFNTGGRGATQTFIERSVGDVLVTFEAEVKRIKKVYKEKDLVEITPSRSIFAAFPVAIVYKNTKKNGSTKVARAYLDWLYSQEAQNIIAQNFYRITNAKILKKYKNLWTPLKLNTVDDIYGGWEKIQRDHFKSNGILDQILIKRGS